MKIVDSLDVPAADKPRIRESRIRIVAAYIRYASEPEVRVELALNGSTYTGQARYDASNPVEAAMAAFLNAFHQMGLGEVSPIFAHEIPGCLSHGNLVITKLRYECDEHATDLLGIAESHQDLILCTVRACLDALNRRVALYWFDNSCPAEPNRMGRVLNEEAHHSHSFHCSFNSRSCRGSAGRYGPLPLAAVSR